MDKLFSTVGVGMYSGDRPDKAVDGAVGLYSGECFDGVVGLYSGDPAGELGRYCGEFGPI